MHPRSFAVLAVVLLNCLLAFAASISSNHARNADSGLGVRQWMEGIENWMNLTSSGAGIIPLGFSKDTESYFALISVGDISFQVALDTASSDLWLVSSACSSSPCAAVPRYQLGYHSPTFVPVNNNQTAFNISFLDGTGASGFVARESVEVANLTVASQAFGLVTSSNVTLDDDISGVLGLGFPRLSSISSSVVNATPFFATLAQQGQLNYPLFGMSLTRNASGSLTLGAVDASVVTNRSLIEWNEVVPFAPFGSESNTSSYLQWVIRLSGISVNGTELNPIPTYPDATSNTSLALLDVGSPGLYGPFQDVARIYSLIEGSRLVDTDGQWVVPCDASEVMNFTFGKQNFTLQPTDYLIGPASGDPDLCLSWPVALPPSSDGIDWQLGGVFLRTVYSIFSLGIDAKEPPMIGLYPLNNASAPIESPEAVASFFSSASATVATTLPNFVLSTPSFTTPPYAFNTSVTAPPGLIVSSGLATSTYSPVLNTRHLDATALPTLSPSPTLFTLIQTNSAGQIVTSVSTALAPSVTLGQPPGWTSGAARVHIGAHVIASSIVAVSLYLFI
ncbi:acid protease [Obba rivulosa]|uniref:Acid protease n=1 Tax=Obba rivulosa TaxID=1052685 RepID=A0A8E2DTL8_9APHY|nr:acid protease [Obba rivulosa]